MKKEKRNIIVGIDPGTTTAYAVLDTNGSILSKKSAKGLNLDSILRETAFYGIPLLVGTDRRKCPGMVAKYAAKTGAIKVVPAYDLPETEKNAMTRGIETENAHDKDAIASAIVAYRQYEPLLRRIERFLSNAGKSEFAEHVKSIVLQKKISIDKALKLAEPLVSTN
jgi:uncharacterized protein